MVRSVLAAFLLCLVSPAWGQSWCGNGMLNPTEWTICSTPELGQRDTRLEQAYAAVRHLPGLPSDQQDWLAQRNACGTNVGCIRNAYDNRIATLQGIAASGGMGGGGKPAGPPVAPRPAWCAEGALNPAETMICAYPDLRQMDLYMTDLYNQVRSYPGVQTDQRNWLTARNACRSNYSCLQAAYSGRISQLQDRYGIN